MQESKKYSEIELVALLKQRRQSAFSYLYDNYSASLYGVVVAIVADRNLANDVLQEVFVKIWRQIEGYDETKGRLFTWMINIARNAAIDMVRSKAYQNSLQNRELTETVYETADAAPFNYDKIGLRKIVHHLKEEHKVLLELSYFEGYTQDEISKMLNIPLGTVKTRLRAALIQLRELLKQ
ncbi:MAG: RNA polymerase sigma factor [Ilyomonas sp.]